MTRHVTLSLGTSPLSSKVARCVVSRGSGTPSAVLNMTSRGIRLTVRLMSRTFVKVGVRGRVGVRVGVTIRVGARVRVRVSDEG